MEASWKRADCRLAPLVKGRKIYKRSRQSGILERQFENMKFVFAFFLFSATAFAADSSAVALAPPPQPKSGLSFQEAYRAALKRSETVGIQDQAVVRAAELETQAKSVLMPNLSANATFFRQDTPNNTVAGEQNTVKITGTQPLFHGLREFAVIRQRRATTEQQRALLQDAARLLFYDVADAYYGTIGLQADERNFSNELAVNRQRLKDLEGFRRVGRSRTSEVLSQKANIAQLEASVEGVRGQLLVQRQVLAFLTGLPATTPLKDDEPGLTSVDKLENYLASLNTRPDLLASKASLESAESAVSAARSFHWPTADLTGNYYLHRPSGSSKEVKWDVSLLVTLSLFQGGAVQSQVREAVAVEEQANLQLSRSQRLADQEIRRYYDRVTSGRTQLERLNEFAELSRQNYQAQQRDYSNGLVTNLDVLQATSGWQVSLRTRERQLYAVKSDFLKLQAAAGRRSETKIESQAD